MQFRKQSNLKTELNICIYIVPFTPASKQKKQQQQNTSFHLSLSREHTNPPLTRYHLSGFIAQFVKASRWHCEVTDIEPNLKHY